MSKARYIEKRRSGRYQVRVPAGNGKRYVGSFPDLESAIKARDEAMHGALPEPPDHKCEDATNGNIRTVNYVSPDVRTLDDLIKACGIDTDTWEITRWEANKWAVGARTARRHLSFDDGRMTGELDDRGELTVAPLFQVKAWLVRKIPVEVRPAVKPVMVNFIPLPKPLVSAEIRRELVLCDAQIGYRRDRRNGDLKPFHDLAALGVALQIAQRVQFSGIKVLGDWVDCTEFSDKFVREDEFYFTTQPALNNAAWWLNQFANLAPMDYIEGNHEQRLPLAVQNHLLAAYQLHPANDVSLPPAISLECLLGLERAGIKWHSGYPNNEIYLTDDLCLTHGATAKAAAGSTAAKLIERPVSTIFGHIHRIERAARTEYRHGSARTITAACPGCLCRIDGAVPGHNTGQNWQQGVGVISYNESYHNIELVEIKHGQAAYSGLFFKQRQVEHDYA